MKLEPFGTVRLPSKTHRTTNIPVHPDTISFDSGRKEVRLTLNHKMTLCFPADRLALTIMKLGNTSASHTSIVMDDSEDSQDLGVQTSRSFPATIPFSGV